jgi:hypothetical protein
VSYLVTLVAFRSFSLLALGLMFALSVSSTTSLSFRAFLYIVDFYSVRVATLLTSGLAGSSIARSSAILRSIFLVYKSFVEFIV